MNDARKIGPLTIREQVQHGRPTGKWFLDIPARLTNNGKRVRRLYSSRKDAETVARHLKPKLEMHRLGYVEAAPKPGLPFKDAVALWEEALELDVQTLSLRSSSMRAIRTRLKPLRAYFGRSDVATIKSDDIKRFQKHRLDSNRKPATVNGETRVLRQFLGWLHKHGHLQELPQARKVREPRLRVEIPTQDEVVRLLAYLPRRTRVLVRLMAETGLRPGEAFNLPWAHVDLSRGTVEVAPFGNWQPKTEASRRLVRPSGVLMAELETLPKKSVYVFPGKKPTKPIQNIRSAIATAARRAGLSRDGKPLRLPVKMFRKAFATWQAQRGLHPRVLQSLMGHSPGSKVTDEHYIHPTDDAMRSLGLTLPVVQPQKAA